MAELLVLLGEKNEGHKRKACFRAAHSAFMWPEEAATLLEQSRSLTELTGIGPYLAKEITDWIESPPPTSPPPDIRQNFITLTEARAVLTDHPEWTVRLKGDLQMHTEWSDGTGTIQAMADSALERGYEYIGITDHTKGLSIAGGINETELRKQGREIDGLNESFACAGKPFRVLKSTELNLSPTGEGDMDPVALDELDLVLGSFHSALRKTIDQTDRYIAALSNPHLNILGHPRGRVYNYRLGLKADWSRVFAEAARMDKAVEIDGYSDRQDLDLELLQLTRKEGVRISFGSDAHHPWQLVFLELSLASALLARIPPDRILNFLSPTDLLAWANGTHG